MKTGIDIYLQESFEKWLKTLGYSQSTVSGSSLCVRYFFIWLLKQGIREIGQISPQVAKNYVSYLKNRKKKGESGALSTNYIISNIDALGRFGKYLQQTGKGHLEVQARPRAKLAKTRQIPTRAEIAALYKACANDYLGLRDRAILGIYYGCGLRRGEGLALDVKDILLKEKRVFVRKGKNYKERYVPMAPAVKEDLENYIYTAREKMSNFGHKRKEKGDALFFGIRGQRLGGSGMEARLKKLAKTAAIQKDISLHALRHSIATHLLQSGMGLEEIQQFLGHGSLESTQIYTHIVNDYQLAT